MTHGLWPQLYADNKIYGFRHLGDAAQLQSHVSACLGTVGSWTGCALKTEARLVGSTNFQTICWRWVWIPLAHKICRGSWHSLWFRYVDADACHANCIQPLRSSTPYSQHQSVRQSISLTVTHCVTGAVTFGLGSGTLACLPARLLERPQSVLNAASQLVSGSRMNVHLTPLLHDLHWHRVPDQSRMYHVSARDTSQHGRAPLYLADELRCVADVES